MGPASYIDCDTDGGWMSCGIFDMYTHDRVFSTHTLRSESDGIDTVLEQFFHGSSTFIFVMASQRTHQCFLG